MLYRLNTHTIGCYRQHPFPFRYGQSQVSEAWLERQGALDDGAMWPNSYALIKLTSNHTVKTKALMKK